MLTDEIMIANRRTSHVRRLTDAIDPDLALIQRLATSRGCSATLRAAARVLAKAGMSGASLALLERADEVLDVASELMEVRT